MKFILGLFIIFMICVPLKAVDTVVLPEIFNPWHILVDDSRIFVTQEVNVFVYNKKDFKLLHKFGQAGEGPREFFKSSAPFIPSITVYLKGENLLINSFGKVSFFSKSGDYIEEHPLPGSIGRYIPLGDQYAFMKIIVENDLQQVAAILVDPQFKTVKNIFLIPFPAQPGKKRDPIRMALMTTLFDRYSDREKLVLPTPEGVFHVFDKEGKETASFSPAYTRVSVANEMKKKLDDFFANDIRYKENYSIDKTRNLIELPDYMPLLRDYRLDHGLICVISSYNQDNKYETFIYDLAGKLKKKKFLPLVDKDMLMFFPFCLNDNKIYQIVLSEDEEECLLKITPIK